LDTTGQGELRPCDDGAMRSLVILVALAAIADAKPLPKGMTIAIANNRPVATRDGVTVEITDGDRAEWGKLVKAQLSDKGDEIVIDAPTCHGGTTDPTTLSLAVVEAKLENAIGMGFHLKKQYDKAIEHFAIAVAKDPHEVYETNLLSAQSLGGKLDDADKTIAAWGPKAHGWFAWRLLVDSDLAPLKGRASTKGFAIKSGSARIATGPVAYSPAGLVAFQTDEIYEGIGSAVDSFVTILDVTSGVTLVQLPIGSECAIENPQQGPSKACQKKQAAAAAPLIKRADALLARLGFEPVPKSAVRPYFADSLTISSADGRKLVFADGGAKLVIGGTAKHFDIEPTSSAALVPKAIVVARRNKNKTSCDDGLYYWTVDVTATP
jgi:hypothetical protein